MWRGWGGSTIFLGPTGWLAPAPSQSWLLSKTQQRRLISECRRNQLKDFLMVVRIMGSSRWRVLYLWVNCALSDPAVAVVIGMRPRRRAWRRLILSPTNCVLCVHDDDWVVITTLPASAALQETPDFISAPLLLTQASREQALCRNVTRNKLMMHASLSLYQLPPLPLPSPACLSPSPSYPPHVSTEGS